MTHLQHAPVSAGLRLCAALAPANAARGQDHSAHGRAPSTAASTATSVPKPITMEALHAAGGVPPGWRFGVPPGDATKRAQPEAFGGK